MVTTISTQSQNKVTSISTKQTSVSLMLSFNASALCSESWVASPDAVGESSVWFKGSQKTKFKGRVCYKYITV